MSNFTNNIQRTCFLNFIKIRVVRRVLQLGFIVDLVFLIFNPRLEVRCSHESTEGFSQRSRRGGPSGLASPQEGGPETPGQQVEKILVCPEEQFSVLVHRQDGESHGDQQQFVPVGSLKNIE